ASSGLSEEEIKRMKAEAEANADADKRAKEEIEKVNAADGFWFSASLSKCHRHFFIFQSEKNLKEYGDKIPGEKKTAIENALNELRAAHSARNIGQIDAAMEKINAAWQSASEDMYNAQQQTGGANAGAGFNPGSMGGNPNAGQQPNAGDDNVTDVDFEEVK
ncbi:MAG: Hsp70 family protein, partial [Bacteroidales bacterium]|nr:Hsp70 family protein [Bacteroidales bacterium]